MLVKFKKAIDKSTEYFDEPSEKVTYFILVIVLSWFTHYMMYTACPDLFQINEDILDKKTAGFTDFGWFSTFASFGFYFGEIIPKSNAIRFLVLIQIVAVWYIMLS